MVMGRHHTIRLERSMSQWANSWALDSKCTLRIWSMKARQTEDRLSSVLRLSNSQMSTLRCNWSGLMCGMWLVGVSVCVAARRITSVRSEGRSPGLTVTWQHTNSRTNITLKASICESSKYRSLRYATLIKMHGSSLLWSLLTVKSWTLGSLQWMTWLRARQLSTAREDAHLSWTTSSCTRDLLLLIISELAGQSHSLLRSITQRQTACQLK